MKLSKRNYLVGLIFISILLGAVLIFGATPTHATTLSQSSDEFPLYPQWRWSFLGSWTEIVSINDGRVSFPLSGSVYQSDPIQSKFSAEVLDYYSETHLSQLGWNYLGDPGAVLLGVSTFFKSPNRYMTIRAGMCNTLTPTDLCVRIWISAPDVQAQIPVFPTPQPARPRPPSAPQAPTYANPLPVPTFSQNDNTWKTDRLGFPDAGHPTACDPYTLGGYGCWTTSYSMLYNYYQSGNTNPRDLNNKLSTGPGGGPKYTSNGAYCNDMMPTGSPYAPSGVSRGPTYENICTTSNCVDSDNVTRIDNEINAGRPILGLVHWPGVGNSNHMVVITGHSGSTFYINDPGDGGQRTLANGYYYTFDVK